VTLGRAYRHCAEVTRRSGSNFAAAFWLLSAERRRAIHAIYAFCRLADDIADDPAIEGDRSRLLEVWRRELELAYLQKSEHPVGVALGDTVHRFRLPEEVFLDLLRGVESDVLAEPVQTCDDLTRYCYRVASTVGLLVVRVLGARDPRSLEYAEALGIAVQLTNILRPESERRRLRPAEAMGKIYRALLEKIYRERFPCFGPPLRLSKSRRTAIAASVWLGRGRT
jgi:phytoene synthase